MHLRVAARLWEFSLIVTEAAREFGETLRRERERRGITLEHVAAATKISATVMGALERGDLSRWPNGLFRRSFVRAYAEVVGLPVEQVVQTFVDVHGDEAHAPRTVETRRIEQACNGELQALRLRLAGEPQRPLSTWLSHGVAVAIDIAVPSAVGAAAAILAGLPTMLGVGGAAACWLLLGSVFGGRTPGHDVVRRWSRARADVPATIAVPSSAIPDAVTVASTEPDGEPRRAGEPARQAVRIRRAARERARVHRANRHA